MLNRRKFIDKSDACTIDIGSDIIHARSILAAAPSETVFVVDSAWHLYGIISLGDLIRKAAHSKNIRELLNSKFRKIELDVSDEPDDVYVQHMAGEIFRDGKNIRKIPVVENGRFLYVVDCELEAVHEFFHIEGEQAKKLTSYDTYAGKETSNPLVRVFVTTFNNAEFVKGNLDGILMQKTEFPFEIYVFDDCSTDGTSEIIREYARKYPCIIADIQPENMYSKSMRLWQKIVWSKFNDHNCKYIAVADGDDFWTDPYKLCLQVEFLERHDDFSMCSGGYMVLDHVSGAQKVQMVNLGGTVGLEYDFSTAYLYGDLVRNFTRVYRTDAIPEYTISENYEWFVDVHIAYYVLCKGKGFYFSRILGVYNVHQGGLYSSLGNDERIELSYKWCEELYRTMRDKQAKDCLLLLLRYYFYEGLKDIEKQAAFCSTSYIRPVSTGRYL